MAGVFRACDKPRTRVSPRVSVPGVWGRYGLFRTLLAGRVAGSGSRFHLRVDDLHCREHSDVVGQSGSLGDGRSEAERGRIHVAAGAQVGLGDQAGQLLVTGS